MKNFELIRGRGDGLQAFTEGAFSDQVDAVFKLRVFLWTGLLIFSVGYQFVQAQFIAVDIWLPVLTALAAVLGCNAIVINSSSFQDSKQAAWLLVVDLLCAGAIVQATGGSNSVLTLLFSVTVIFAGIVLSRGGALVMALGAAIYFNFIVLLNPLLSGQEILFSIGINNVSFFALAFLGGQLSEQVRFLGSELIETKKDVLALQDLNKLVIENIGTGLLVTNPFGMIIYANESAQGILDHTQIVDSNIGDVLPEIAEAQRQGQVTDGKGEVTRFDLSYVNKQKLKLNVEALVSHVYADEKSRGLLILVQDLTLIKNYEQQMRQKEKLAAVGQLAAGIAHEIRNPLASISGSIQMLTATSDALTNEDRKLMSIVLKEIDRLNDLISEFLDYVKPEIKATQRVDVNPLLVEVLEMVKLNKKLRQDIVVTRELHAGQSILGHKDKLKQAFLNIIINALQAMEKVDKAELRVATYDEGNTVIVRIQDTGIGIPDESINRIFEPFHTTKPGGTGLGLAITHKILQTHDAVVTVTSEVGVGTQFHIEFPGERGRFEGEVKELKLA